MLAQNASTNGGDASRVGHEGKGSQTRAQLVLSVSLYLVYGQGIFPDARRVAPIRACV